MIAKRSAYKLIRTVAVILVLLFAVSMTVSANVAPDILPEAVESTQEGLITLKAPEQLITSTNNRKLPISATAPQGTLVSLYRYNETTGNYEKIVANDVPIESVVGSTMLFAGRVDLFTGSNKFLIRGAQDEETYTVTKFEVNVLSESFMDRIQSIISSFFN